jgi:hypothetical protein
MVLSRVKKSGSAEPSHFSRGLVRWLHLSRCTRGLPCCRAWELEQALTANVKKALITRSKGSL